MPKAKKTGAKDAPKAAPKAVPKKGPRCAPATAVDQAAPVHVAVAALKKTVTRAPAKKKVSVKNQLAQAQAEIARLKRMFFVVPPGVRVDHASPDEVATKSPAQASSALTTPAASPAGSTRSMEVNKAAMPPPRPISTKGARMAAPLPPVWFNLLYTQCTRFDRMQQSRASCHTTSALRPHLGTQRHRHSRHLVYFHIWGPSLAPAQAFISMAASFRQSGVPTVLGAEAPTVWLMYSLLASLRRASPNAISYETCSSRWQVIQMARFPSWSRPFKQCSDQHLTTSGRLTGMPYSPEDGVDAARLKAKELCDTAQITACPAAAHTCQSSGQPPTALSQRQTYATVVPSAACRAPHT
jgi:hypothetical protein